MRLMHVMGGGEKGGSKQYLLTLATELTKRGYEIELVCLLDDVVARDAREVGLKVTVFSMKHLADFSVISRLRQHIRKQKPDILHTHGVRANFMGRLAARTCRVPVVTTVHSSVYHDYSHPLKKAFYHRIEKWTRAYTHTFIAVAGSLKKELEQDGIQPERVRVVYNGLSRTFINQLTKPSHDVEAQAPVNSLTKAKPASAGIRQELGMAQDIPLLLTVGRLEGVKNQAFLLKVWQGLSQRGIPFYGLLVGDGPLRHELEQMIEQLGLTQQVRLLGFRQDIYELMREADLFMLTSRMEGMPITLLEAMATETPVIVSAVGGMPEIVQLAQNGYAIPMDDEALFIEKLAELIQQPNERARFAQQGRQALLDRFTIDRFVEDTVTVYKDVIKNLNG